MSEPTDEQIRRVLAEFEGWSDFWEADQGGRHWLMGVHPAHAADYYALENERIELPDYVNDLNAMHAIEWLLHEQGLYKSYIVMLEPIVGASYQREEEVGLYTFWHYAHATAHQRALAAYQVITALEQKGATE